MNPKTLGIFGGAAALCIVAVFLVVRNGTLMPPPPPSTPPKPPIFSPPPPTSLKPNSEVTFGNRVRAHAMLSQSHVLSGASTELFVNIDLTATGETSRQPLAAALVIDRSGSMAGVKIDNARDAALAFLARMRDQDHIAIITYGSDVTADLGLSRVGDVRTRAQRIIVGIDAGGGTNISGGLKSAIRQLTSANGPRRIVLVSDGRPTEGIRSSHRLAAIASDGLERGMSFSTIGVGLDYDENVMERIALKGGGGYYHLRRASALASILGKEFKAVESMLASNVRLRIDPADRVSITEIFGYDLQREGNAVVVRVGDISQGDKLRLVARALVNASATQSVQKFAGLGLNYQLPASGTGESASAHLSLASTSQATLVSGSQQADIVANGYRVEAAAALRDSMEKMSERDRSTAVSKLRKAKKRLKAAAKAAPAAAQPMIMQQAKAFDDLENTAGSISFDSAEGKDFVKKNRASSFEEQRM